MDNKKLFDMAVKAAENSYSRYSKFRVGAALLTADGRVFTGCNIENASYSLTVCAERTAIFKAVSEGITDFRAIAVAGSGTDDFTKACPPCGACLQVINEFCGGNADFEVILSDRTGKLRDFLPFGFDEESME